MKIKVKSTYPSTIIGDELAIVNYETGSYILLNQVGGIIWEKISKTEYEVDQLIAEILGEYEVAEKDCRSGVNGFLQKLVDSKLIELL